MVKFRCANCKQKIGVPEEYAGKRVRCPRCKQAATVPHATDVAVEAPSGVAPATPAPKPVAPAARVEAPPTIAPQAEPTAPAAKPNSSVPSEPVVAVAPAPDLASIFAQYLPTEADPKHALMDDLWEDRLPRGADPSAIADPAVEHSESLNLSQTMEVVEAPQPVKPQTPVTAEIMDAPPARPPRPAPTSDEELNDLLRDLGEPDFSPEAAPPPYPPDTVPDLGEEPPSSPPASEQPEPAPAVSEIAVRPERPAGTGAALLGIAAIMLGLAAVALCWLTRWDKFAVPVGTAGLVLALSGVAIAALRGASGIALASVGTLVAAIGIAVPILGAYGMVLLPGRIHRPALRPTPVVDVSLTGSEATASQAAQRIPADGYIAATSPIIAGEVEVRISSVRIVQPVVHDGRWNNLHSLPDKRLLVSLTIKDVAPAGHVSYRTWAQPIDAEQAKLTDGAGNALKQIDTAPLVPVGRVSENPTSLYTSRGPLPDVLIFERPADPSQDLKLELPGANIGMPATTLRIRIPAEMIKE